MVLAGLVHRMVGRPNAHKAGDIAEFGDMGVGDVAVTFAIGIVAELAVQHPRATTHLGEPAKTSVGNKAVFVNERCVTEGLSIRTRQIT